MEKNVARSLKMKISYNLVVYSPITLEANGGPAKIGLFLMKLWKKYDLGQLIFVQEDCWSRKRFHVKKSEFGFIISIGGKSALDRKKNVIIVLRRLIKRSSVLYLGQLIVAFFSSFPFKNKHKHYFRYNGEPIYERIANIFPNIKIEMYYKFLNFFILPKLIIKIFLLMFDKIIVSSYSSKHYIESYYNVRKNIFKIENPPSILLSSHIEPYNRKIDVLIVGRLIKLKRVDLALKMIPKRLQVHVIGDGPEKNKLVSMYPSVIFHGLIPNNELVNFYLNTKFLISMSVSEQSPNVVVEAKSLGCKFIGSDIPVHRELSDSEDLILSDVQINNAKTIINEYFLSYKKNSRVIADNKNYIKKIEMTYRHVLCC